MKKIFSNFTLFLGAVFASLAIGACSKTETQLVKAPVAPSVEYQNTTYTPVNINVNGTAYVIPVFGTLSFSGKTGDSISAFANTKGALGLTVSWNNLNTVFPASGTTYIPLSADSFFYVSIVNTSSEIWTTLRIYSGTPYQTIESVSIPSDSVVNYIGYYKKYSKPGDEVAIRLSNDVDFRSSNGIILGGSKNDIVGFWTY